MRKILIFTLLLFVANLCGAENSLFAQRGNAKTIYGVPASLELNNNSSNGDANVTPTARIIEKFYPIGWSKKGVFAYYLEPADEACGCYFAELVIQDMRTDKILWKREYNSDENAEVDLKSYWKKNQREFSRKLAQYNIKAEKNFTLLPLPIKFQTDILTPEVNVKLKIDNEDSVEGKVILRLLSKNDGSKTIYEKIYKKSYDSIRSAEIGGVLLSPFEPRAAIIMVETLRGYEGPPNITNIKIVGATLNGGFK